MYKIAIVVPFYGGKSYLSKMLSSLQIESEKYNTTIYIIDNSKAEDKLSKEIERDSNIKLIEAGIGIGYGRACNIGYELCKNIQSDILVIVNQDGFFKEGSLQLMLDTLIDEEKFSIAVPLLTKYDSEIVESFFTHVYLTPLEDLISDLFRGRLLPFYKIEQLCGAAFALKMNDYKGYNYLFDEMYHMYYEDADLYERISRLGKHVMLVPGAVFHHKHTNTSEAQKTIYFEAVQRTSRHLFYLKNRKKYLIRTFGAWALLEFRTILEKFFSLKFKEVLVEIISLALALKKIPLLLKRRNDKSFNNPIQNSV